MRIQKSPFLLLSMTLLFGIAASQLAAQKPSKDGGSGYTILHLETGLETEFDYVSVTDINEYDLVTHQTDIVGRVRDLNGVIHPMFWTVENSTVTPIELISGMSLEPEPLGVNDLNQIVGKDDSELLPLLWSDPMAAPVILPLPPLSLETNRGVAEKINNQGIIVGSSVDGGRPLAWHVVHIAGELVISDPIDLGGLTLDGRAAAIDVANSQELEDANGEPILATRIAGNAKDADGNTRPVMWELTSSYGQLGEPQLTVQTGPTDLGTLPGHLENTPRAMNHHGDVCGSPGSLKLYGMPMMALAKLKTNTNGLSSPDDINDRTEIVGKFYYGVGEQATVLWQANGKAVDLNKFTRGTGWSYLDTTDGINNFGAIAGTGTRYLNGKKNSPRVFSAFVMIPQ